MKTTIEVPDELFRKAKAAAATRGMTLGRFVVEAVGAHLVTGGKGGGRDTGWRSVFGKAPKGATKEIDAIIEKEFKRINPETWK